MYQLFGNMIHVEIEVNHDRLQKVLFIKRVGQISSFNLKKCSLCAQIIGFL